MASPLLCLSRVASSKRLSPVLCPAPMAGEIRSVGGGVPAYLGLYPCPFPSLGPCHDPCHGLLGGKRADVCGMRNLAHLAFYLIPARGGACLWQQP